jgi:hypothetical protein
MVHLTWSDAIGKRVRSGDPVRVVEPPVWGGSADAASTRRQCKWTVYKTLEAIPEAAYERIGMKKPGLPVIQPGEAPGR